MGNDVDNKNKSVILTYTNIKHEMKEKTEEFSTKHLTMGPQLVWAEVKRWANEEYGGNWSGLKEHQVTELARKCHKKLGLCDAIGTIENTPDYNKMTTQDSRGYTGDFSGMQKKKCTLVPRTQEKNKHHPTKPKSPISAFDDDVGY